MAFSSFQETSVRMTRLRSALGCLPLLTPLPARLIDYCTFQERADSEIQSPTGKCIFRYRQSNVRRFLLASDYCRALFRCLNCAERFYYRALGSSRKLGEAAEYLFDGSEKRICRLSFEFQSPHVIRREERVKSLRTFAWEALCTNY